MGETITPPVVVPIAAAPFTQAAIDAALPHRVGRTEQATTPQAAPESTVQAVEPPPTAADEGAASAAVAPEAPAEQQPPSKLAEAEAAAARIVAKRRQQRAAREAEQSRVAHLEREAQQARHEAQQARAVAERIERDPLAVMRERGIPEKALAQAAIDENTPEGRAAKAERIAQEAAARAERLEQQLQQRDQAQNIERGRTVFVEQAMAREGDAPVYPYLAAHLKVRRHEVIAEAEGVMNRAIAAGKRPTFAQVHELLEWRYSEAAKQAAALAKTEASTAPVAEEAAQKAAAAAPPKRPAAAGTRTLAGKKVAPAAAPKPVGKMSKEEWIEHAAAQLRAITPQER